MPQTRRRASRKPKEVDTIRHSDATRPNLPSAEHQSLMGEDEQSPIQDEQSPIQDEQSPIQVALGVVRGFRLGG